MVTRNSVSEALTTSLPGGRRRDGIRIEAVMARLEALIVVTDLQLRAL